MRHECRTCGHVWFQGGFVWVCPECQSDWITNEEDGLDATAACARRAR